MKCDFTLSFDVDGSVGSEQVCISEHGSATEDSGCMSGKGMCSSCTLSDGSFCCKWLTSGSHTGNITAVDIFNSNDIADTQLELLSLMSE